MKIKVLLVGTFFSTLPIFGWDVTVVNKSDASYQIVGCFSAGTVTECDIGTDVITIGPNSSAAIPLPAGPGSCLNHIYYRRV